MERLVLKLTGEVARSEDDGDSPRNACSRSSRVNSRIAAWG